MNNNTNNIAYKDSPLGEIPVDWKTVRLGDILIKKIQNGITVSSNKIGTGNTFIIQLNDLYNADMYIANKGLYNVDIDLKQINSYLLENNDLLVNRVSIKKEGVGKVMLFKNQSDKPTVFESNMFQIRLDKFKANPYFILQQSRSELFFRQLMGKAKVSNQTSISQNDILNINITLPLLSEQEAIGKILSAWDTSITNTNQLIVQIELRKKWLMQQLLSGKKRLKGFENTKWNFQPLETFIKSIVREVDKPNDPYLGIGIRSHGKGTFLKPDEHPEKNSMDKFYVVRPDDLIVNITFAWEQAIAIARTEDDGALASHRFPTFTFIKDKGHHDFFRFYILQPRMKYMLQLISPGGAGRNRVMSKSDFIKLEFLLPEYKEQTAIAQVLQTANKEIQLLKAKVEKLKEEKKGMMQVLLTGKKRLSYK